MKDATKDWVTIAESDLEMVSAAMERRLYSQAVFHCQQAAEKMLKAIWADTRDEIPPRTHNLVDLASELEVVGTDETFLRELTNAGVAGRYAGGQPYTDAMAIQFERKTRELCERLRKNLT